MKKTNLAVAIAAGVLVGLLTIPTINNLPLPSGLVALGTIAVAISLGLLTIGGYILSEILARFLKIFSQLGRFAVVGVLNTVLDFAILNLLIDATGLSSGLGFSVIKATSFIVAVTNSYFWNKYWTFEVQSQVSKEFVQFITISLIGLLANVGAASLVVNILAPEGANLTAWANLGALAGTFAGLAWNFVGYKFIVFKEK